MQNREAENVWHSCKHLEPIPGEYDLPTFLRNTYLTARDGGHHSVDALITTAVTTGQDEKFTLAATASNFGIQGAAQLPRLGRQWRQSW